MGRNASRRHTSAPARSYSQHGQRPALQSLQQWSDAALYAELRARGALSSAQANMPVGYPVLPAGSRERPVNTPIAALSQMYQPRPAPINASAYGAYSQYNPQNQYQQHGMQPAPSQSQFPAVPFGQNTSGTNSIPVDAYADTTLGQNVFSPGDPLRPTPGMGDGLGGPRQYAYPVGVNIAPVPRATEATPFETLRNLAAIYSGIQVCELVKQRILDRLELQIVPSPDALAEGEDPSADKWRKPALGMRDWLLDGPDKRGMADLNSWLKAILRDLDELDAVGVFHHRTRGGGLYALEYVAGDTLTCLVDAGGRTPLPPYPAYQQVVYGTPGSLYSTEMLDYLKMTYRTDSHYGLPPVERIILNVNQALRKQQYDLARYTDGSTPEGVIQTSDPSLVNMTPQEAQEWEHMFNSLLAGNAQMRVRAKMLPPSFTFTSTRQAEIATDFDRFLLNMTTAAFGFTLDEIGFTETSNRSVGAAQENVMYRNAVQPNAAYLARYLSRLLKRYDGTPLSSVNATVSRARRPTTPKYGSGVWDARYIVQWGGIEEPEDWNGKVISYVQLVNTGIVTRTQAKQLLKLPMTPNEEPIPLMITAEGGAQAVAIVDDLLKQRDQQLEAQSAQLDAQIAGSKQTVEAFKSGVNPVQAQGQLSQQKDAAQGNAPPPAQPAQPVAQKASGAASGSGSQPQPKASGSSSASKSDDSATSDDQSEAGDNADDNADDNQGDKDNATRNHGRVFAPGDQPRAAGGSGGWREERLDGGRGWNADADVYPDASSDASGSAAGPDLSLSLSLSPSARTSRATGASATEARASSAASSETTARQAEPAARARATASSSEPGDSSAASGSDGGSDGSDALRIELRRYREKALNAVKQGKRIPSFASAVLPASLHEALEAALSRCADRDDVRAVFAEYLASPTPQTPPAPLQRDADTSSTPAGHTGIMVAFFLDPATAAKLALPGYEPAHDLHVTVVFLGDSRDYTDAQLTTLRQTVQDAANDLAPLSGRVSGIGRFTPSPSSEGKAPIYASVDVKQLHEAHDALVERLKAAGFAPANDFAYTPHITLAYVDEGAPAPVQSVEALPLRFDTLWLAIGDKRYAFPLGGSEMRNVIVSELRSMRADVLAALA